MVRFPTGHYWHCNWSVQKASPGMCPCKWWTFEHFLWTNSCKRFAFIMSFWFKWLLSDFYCVDAWWSISLPCLTAKALIKLVRDSERIKSKMLLFCIIYYINGRRKCAPYMGTLAEAGWAWSACGKTRYGEVGVDGWPWSLHGKQLGAMGTSSARWLGVF